ncbi:hypothetical protein ACQ86G_13250 [Roseateles chitinivorans]|uniref:hypothetical protein n=1 Tax=Roseateles chitinivorans TaxID=2917965 RepID=UPI003D6723F4
MDVYYFLQQRTEFIKHFYDTATTPMFETKRLIEASDVPYNDPPFDDSGEPAYLEEWLRADVEIEVVGRAAVSMLSESIKHFFVTWERRLWAGDRPCQKELPKVFKSEGFVSGYRACFQEALGIDFSAAPADLGIIEQVVLARNDSQHHGDLLRSHVEHSDATRAKYPRPFFMRPDELEPDDSPGNFMNPSLHINRESLFEAIHQLELFCSWLQAQIEEAWMRKRRESRQSASSDATSEGQT